MQSFHKTVTSKRTFKGMQCTVALRIVQGLLCMQADNTATASCNNQQFEFCLLPGIRQVYTVQIK